VRECSGAFQSREKASIGQSFAKSGERFANEDVYFVVIRFFEEKTVVPLKEIRSYRFNWYLHDPIFAKKWWFLVLTVTLKNDDERVWPRHVRQIQLPQR
jgi:hypothetical protein